MTIIKRHIADQMRGLFRKAFLFSLICAPFQISCNDVDEDFFAIKEKAHKLGDIKNKISCNNSIHKKSKILSYYLYIADFIKSFIAIPTSNVLDDSSTISSKYLAGRASIYNKKDRKVGTCSASFLCMQNENGIFTDISNYLSVDNGLIITWFTPTTLINLELDSIVHSMVTECIVKASTKVGFNPFYGKNFNMIVSSDENKIYFKLTEI